MAYTWPKRTIHAEKKNLYRRINVFDRIFSLFYYYVLHITK